MGLCGGSRAVTLLRRLYTLDDAPGQQRQPARWSPLLAKFPIFPYSPNGFGSKASLVIGLTPQDVQHVEQPCILFQTGK